MIERLTAFTIEVTSVFLRQALLGFGTVLVLSVALYLVQRWTQRLLARGIGWKGVMYWTGWIGTPVHELSHVIVGKLFRIEIVEFKLFEPDPRTGVLGYVKYVVPKLELKQLHKVIGTFLMGVAPLVGGSLVLGLVFVLCVNPEMDSRYGRQLLALAGQIASASPADVGHGFLALLSASFEAVFAGRLDKPQTWLFVYVTLAVGAHLAPSNADLEGGLVGFLVLCGVVLFANAVAVLAGFNARGAAEVIARATGPLAALLLGALVLNLCNLALAGLLAGGARAIGKRR